MLPLALMLAGPELHKKTREGNHGLLLHLVLLNFN
jgi:hypothetical protein